jgi:hypothetical protein
MTKRPIAALMVVLVLGACGNQANGSAGGRGDDDPTDVVSTTARPSPAPGSSKPRVVRPEGGLDNVIPSSWDKADVAAAGRAARLYWWTGVKECYGLDHVDVDYGTDAVTVTLFAGTRPEAETCIEIAERVVTIVRFDEPLGGRKLVDGA